MMEDVMCNAIVCPLYESLLIEKHLWRKCIWAWEGLDPEIRET